jgi:hypothetical protein
MSKKFEVNFSAKLLVCNELLKFGRKYPVCDWRGAGGMRVVNIGVGGLNKGGRRNYSVRHLDLVLGGRYMGKLFDDLFHAQPDALFMVVGLAFLAVAVIGSVKAYFDPGKWGRIAAGVLGLGLVLFGFHLYTPRPVMAPGQIRPGVGRVGVGRPEGGGPTSTLCQFAQGPKAGTTHDFAGKGQPLRVGAVCRDGQGSEGFVVAAP